MKLALGLIFGLGILSAQEAQAPAPSPSPAPSAPSPTPTPTTPTSPGRFPGQDRQQGPLDPRQQQQQFPDMQRPIFLSGKVLMEDGTPPPEPVKIERICNGQPRPEGYTDSKGRFSIQLGQNTAMMADASVSSTADTFGDPLGGSNRQSGGFGGPGGGRGISERDLMGCELRADLAGYRSDIVNLSGRRILDNPDVGVIVLRSIAGVEGRAISFTTLAAPKDARKAYEKAVDQMKKKKVPEAQKELEKAVSLYPKYAVAWHMLGQIHQQSNRPADARKAYSEAIAADNKYVNPYLQLAALAAGENNWQELADTTDRVIRLNPVQYPQAFFYNSVANYNLQKWDAAEKSAREAVKLDTQHRMPKAQHLLGILLANKNDYAGAVEHIKGYVQFAPTAPDIDQVKKQLAEVEQRLGQTTVTQQTTNP
ncbi:MAG: tetratricopeptide repeat protein [Bryobacterales bacterium]|nr:tetratricopeptide repeat protein [Bryobacterales bacterium]